MEKLSFVLTTCNELEIINGLVVPKGSKVLVGLNCVELPSNERSQKAFKLLFGIRKRPKIVDDEESVAPQIVKEEDSSEEEEISDDEESQEEVIEDSEED